MTDEPVYLTVREAALLLRLSCDSVRRLLANGTLPGVRRGGSGRWLVPARDAHAYLRRPPGMPPVRTQAERDHARAVELLRARGYQV